jgi:hypothetical protein
MIAYKEKEEIKSNIYFKTKVIIFVAELLNVSIIFNTKINFLLDQKHTLKYIFILL